MQAELSLGGQYLTVAASTNDGNSDSVELPLHPVLQPTFERLKTLESENAKFKSEIATFESENAKLKSELEAARSAPKSGICSVM